MQARGGVPPVEQGEGDSTVGVFVRASDAVACALGLQRAMSSNPWPERVDLRVRVALHTGEAVMRDARSYTGPSIHRCARLRAIGHGGQTLLSRSTYELVPGGLPDGSACVLPEIERRLLEQGKRGTFLDLFYSHRSRPSQVFTPPRLLGATARLLARHGCDRPALLREVGTLLAEDLQRKRLNREPVYAVGEPARLARLQP
jgi:class 3 adenylate cyclase